nr:nonribosomal peptide synthetase 1 [Quercus suber]
MVMEALAASGLSTELKFRKSTTSVLAKPAGRTIYSTESVRSRAASGRGKPAERVSSSLTASLRAKAAQISDDHNLVLQGHLFHDEVILYMTHDTSILSTEKVERIAMQCEHVVQQLLSFQNEQATIVTLDDVTVCGPKDIEQILRWNAVAQQPVTVEACVHNLISGTASQAPE